MPVTVSTVLLVGPAYYLVRQMISQPQLVANNEETRHLQDAILTAIGDPRVDRLYLVNAPPSMSPVWNSLRFLAEVGGRPDLRVRVVNTFRGSIRADGGEGMVKLVRRGDELEGVITIGPGQTVLGDLSPGAAGRLGEPGMIEYGPLAHFDLDALGHWTYTGTRFSFRIPHALREDFAIVGLDPSREGVFALLPGTQWTRVS
jgi:hypothetical protein